jgi:probable HAF family extracellular repeat protein
MKTECTSSICRTATALVAAVAASVACADGVPTSIPAVPPSQLSASSTLASDGYMAIDLGVVSVHVSEPAASIAHDINASGTVVGESTDNDLRTSAFIWSKETGMRSLGRLSPGHSFSIANAINDAGWVVGESMNHAVLWKPGEEGTYLLEYDVQSVAFDVNNDGVVVGVYRAPGGTYMNRGFRWASGEFRDLGPLDGSGAAVAINNAGNIVGTACTPTGVCDAAVWDAVGAQKLLGINGTLGISSVARSINDRGDIVGAYHPFSQPFYGSVFLWRPGQGASAVTSTRSDVNGINDSGQIVGSITQTNPAPVLWDPMAGTVWLPGLGGLYGAANAINDAGWIVGYSENAGRFNRAVLWRRNGAPVARIDGPITGMKKKPLAFSAAGSTDPDGDALTFSWSLGDGTPAVAGSSVVHEYAEWGSYTVTLTARDAYGLTSSVTSAITIAPPGQLKPQ